MSNVEYIVVDVFNGEGYSEPSVSKISKDDWLPFICEKLEEYSGKSDFKGYGAERVEFSYNSGEDNAALTLLEKPADKVMLVRIEPDICTVHATNYGSYDEAMAELVDIVSNKENGFDEDDVADFLAGGLKEFASHGDDGFRYYEIID